MSHLIRQIGVLTIATTDMDAAVADMVEIVGMRVAGRTDSAVLLTSNERRAEIVFVHGTAAAVVSMGLEAMNTQAIDEILSRAKAEGFEILHEKPSVPETARSVTISSPEGLVFEIHTAVPRDQPRRYARHGAHVRRLEHFNTQVKSPRATGEILHRVFGMELSERTTGYEFAFFRAQDGYHHTIALSTGPATRLHHYAFDFAAFEDLSKMADTLVSKGRRTLWGPGRHGIGESIYSYWVDVNGAVVETSLEMRRIEDDTTHTPRVWDATEGLDDAWIYQWGSPPPSNFLAPGLGFVSPERIRSVA